MVVDSYSVFRSSFHESGSCFFLYWRVLIKEVCGSIFPSYPSYLKHPLSFSRILCHGCLVFVKTSIIRGILLLKQGKPFYLFYELEYCVNFIRNGRDRSNTILYNPFPLFLIAKQFTFLNQTKTL